MSMSMFLQISYFLQIMTKYSQSWLPEYERDFSQHSVELQSF